MISTIQGDLRSRYFIGDNDSKILNRIADNIEGKCGPDGYIIPGTTRLIGRSVPYLDKIENGGIIRVVVKYETDIVSFSRGDILEVRIVKVNRIGAMAEYTHDGYVVATILLPGDLQKDESVVDSFNRDTVVNVEILDMRYGVGWEKITAVGRVIDESLKTTHEIDNSIEKNVREVEPSGEW